MSATVPEPMFNERAFDGGRFIAFSVESALHDHEWWRMSGATYSTCACGAIWAHRELGQRATGFAE